MNPSSQCYAQILKPQRPPGLNSEAFHTSVYSSLVCKPSLMQHVRWLTRNFISSGERRQKKKNVEVLVTPSSCSTHWDIYWLPFWYLNRISNFLTIIRYSQQNSESGCRKSPLLHTPALLLPVSLTWQVPGQTYHRWLSQNAHTATVA